MGAIACELHVQQWTRCADAVRLCACVRACACVLLARVVIEKPVGHDLASAAALIQALGDSFAQNEVLFVDHYLGKYGLQLMREFPTLAQLVPAASIVRGDSSLDIPHPPPFILLSPHSM